MHRKLHGRAFYESIGSPKLILAPMVDQSEFAWRLLTRSFLPPELEHHLLAYTPMFHARMFTDTPKYRESHFQPLRTPLPSPPDTNQQGQHRPEDRYLDGNPTNDRPLFVQFCANEPNELLEAAQHVQPFCDAVDLNLGCPQGIAKRGRYGAFLQDDWDTIYKLVNTLHTQLDVPVTAKMRILETKEKTLEYAKTILSAGASIITVHGRQREQKGHKTGLADWTVLRYLREQLPSKTVIFANGNILQHADISDCLEATGVDGVMSAEANLYDPSVFAAPPTIGQEGREYWRGEEGKGGYRMDAVLRRYMDIIHRHVLDQDPPARQRLFLPTDLASGPSTSAGDESDGDEQSEGPPKKRIKRAEARKNGSKAERCTNPNLTAMQAHFFHMLRPLVSRHHNVRDALAKCRAGDVDAFENVLTLTEAAVKQGLLEYEKDPAAFETPQDAPKVANENVKPVEEDSYESSVKTVARCARPWWVCQPYVRPLPKEALEKGSLQLSKKELKKLEKEEEGTRKAGLEPEGKIEVMQGGARKAATGDRDERQVEIPRDGVVCG